MTSTDEALRKAIALHEAGQIERAESIYRDLLRIDPRHTDALHLLGVTAHQRGRHQDAVDAIRQSIAVGGPTALSLCNLGAAFRELGRLEDAISGFREAIRLAPTFAGAHYNLSLALEAAGDPAAAESACRRALWTDFRQADAHHQLGCLLASRERYDEAIGCFRTAIDLRPEFLAAHIHLARALRACGRQDESTEHYRRALRFSPDLPDVHYEFGTLLQTLSDIDGAAANYEQTLRLNPHHVQAMQSLSRLRLEHPTAGRHLDDLHRQVMSRPGDVAVRFDYARELERVARFAEAEAVCQDILHVDPDQGQVWELLGKLTLARGESAAGHYRQAVRCIPDDAVLHLNLANALLGPSHTAETSLVETISCEVLAHYRRAVELDPRLAVGWYNLGNALRDIEEYDEAVACFRRALDIDSRFAEARFHLGIALRSHGRLDQSLACWDRVLSDDPDSATARLERALTRIAAGQFAAGWDEYESRWNDQPRPFDGPVWYGSPLATGRLLIYAEQGVGDEIMFASCLPDVLSKAKDCLIECDPRLVPLLARSFPTATVHGRPLTEDSPSDKGSPRFDAQIALGSLPRLFRRDADTFPRHTGYLLADAERVRLWRRRLAELGDGLKIGISWRGGCKPDVRRCRSTTLEQWQPLFSQPGLRFVNLQYGEVQEELASCRKQFGVSIADWDGTDLLNDLDDLAARIAALDLVVSVDNATVHLAGALGVPVWMLLPFAGDFRWQRQTDVTGWYPTMRLFRQPQPRDWSGLFARVAQELHSRG